MLSLALLVGDTAHCLRASLDYLVCAAIRYRGGDPTSSAFPTWGPHSLRNPDLLAKRNSRVARAKKGFIDAIFALEPHQGGQDEWLWVLTEMDNIDKHRALLVVTIRNTETKTSTARHFVTAEGVAIPDMVGVLDLTSQINNRKPLKDGHLLNIWKWDANILKFDVHYTFTETLGEPAPIAGQGIVPTLRNLADCVSRLIDALMPLA